MDHLSREILTTDQKRWIRFVIDVFFDYLSGKDRIEYSIEVQIIRYGFLISMIGDPYLITPQ